MSGEPQGTPPPMPRGEFPMITLVSALIFLYVGFGMAMTGISGNSIYDGSVSGFTLMAKIVGIGLLVVAGLEFFGSRLAIGLDAIVSILAAAGCLLVGAIWIAFSDMQGILIGAFGLLNSNAAVQACRRWRAL
jgi:hypothetical protein